MSQVLHDIEKKIIDSLQKKSEQTPEQLSESTELSIDQIRRGIEWLRLKELAQVKESSKVEISLGQNGIDAFKTGLPERKLMDLIKDGPKTFDEVRTILSGAGFNAAIANAKKNGWVKIDKNESGSKISVKEKTVDNRPYTIQVAAWKSLEEAKKDQLSLTKHGIDAYIQRAFIKNKNAYWWRVRVGNFSDYNQASKVKKQIESLREGSVWIDRIIEN